MNETFIYYQYLLKNNIISMNKNENNFDILIDFLYYKKIIDGQKTEFLSKEIIDMLENIVNTYNLLNYAAFNEFIKKKNKKMNILKKEKITNTINEKLPRLNMVPNLTNLTNLRNK